MDCVDCHNRPATRSIRPRTRPSNRALAMGVIPRDLPFIKREAAAAIGAAYPTQQVANDPIAQKLREFYRTNYNKVYMSRRPDVERAIAGAQQFYARNVFPEMNVGWGTYRTTSGTWTSRAASAATTTTTRRRTARSSGRTARTCHDDSVGPGPEVPGSGQDSACAPAGRP